MAGNRSTDRSGSTKELDHLINRRLEINVEDDILGWESWAHKNSVHPSIIAFAVSNPHIVFPDSVPDKQGPFCTPRSLVAAGNVLVTMSGNNIHANLPTDTDAIEIAAAAIGEAASAQLFATLRLEGELPALETIISAPMQAKLPSKPDAQMLVSYKLASVTDNQNIGQVIKYIERLPKDFAATFARAAITRSPMLLASKSMIDWCAANSAMLAVINSLK
jgi:hypothetical protein